ncbi:hypothetical protein QYF61_012033 [Mycteria americana]|uniref:Uncharacterized protein n=1 Tax=Mycteria americana TaxID=33587 RepID=A0AAN7NS28_MYCAM|nr:hypothetical protein QYF61_012033 [Mycteria americana]
MQIAPQVATVQDLLNFMTNHSGHFSSLSMHLWRAAQPSGTKVRLTSLYYFRSSSSPVLKTEVAFASFQSSGIFPDHYDHSKIIQSDLTVTLDSSLSTWWCPFAMRKAKHIPVFISKSVASRSREVILPFCLSCILFKTVQYVKDTDILEHVQQMTTKTSGHNGRAHCSLQLPTTGGCCEEESRLFSEVGSEKKGGNGHKLKHKKF